MSVTNSEKGERDRHGRAGGKERFMIGFGRGRKGSMDGRTVRFETPLENWEQRGSKKGVSPKHVDGVFFSCSPFVLLTMDVFCMLCCFF